MRPNRIVVRERESRQDIKISYMKSSVAEYSSTKTELAKKLANSFEARLIFTN